MLKPFKLFKKSTTSQAVTSNPANIENESETNDHEDNDDPTKIQLIEFQKARKYHSETALPPIEPGVVFNALLPDFPWVKPFVIDVSKGFLNVIGTLLSDMEAIVNPKNKSDIRFLRIIEEPVSHDCTAYSPYQRKLKVFCDISSFVDSKKEAVAYATEQAVESSLLTCCICGEMTRRVSDIYHDDEQPLITFGHDLDSSNMRACISCEEIALAKIDEPFNDGCAQHLSAEEKEANLRDYESAHAAVSWPFDDEADLVDHNAINDRADLVDNSLFGNLFDDDDDLLVERNQDDRLGSFGDDAIIE